MHTHPDPEVRSELVRLDEARTRSNASRRVSGVQYSGLTREPLAPVTVEQAERNVAARRAFAETPEYRLIQLGKAIEAVAPNAGATFYNARCRGFLGRDGSPNLPTIACALKAINALDCAAAVEARAILTDFLVARPLEAA